uniref:Uncharacterized protein n=1 Tax=Trichobilharzia regenti TaxID=157069 RepID=A0AA85ISI1_TRIRE|nr:unnamed protein product [Trichobilharzia regenti]
MYETTKAAQVAAEMRKYRIEVLGICESRWNGCGRYLLSTGFQITSNQFLYTDQKLGGRVTKNISNSLLQTGPLSTTVFAGFILKIRWPGRKESPTRNYGNKQNKNKPIAIEHICRRKWFEMDWTLAEEATG